MAKILKTTEENLNLCKKALENSQVIAVPTETVYGLAGNALNKDAINDIFKIKGRPLYNPLILHVKCAKSARKYGTFNELAKKMAEHFWPGPLTIVLPKKDIVPDLVTANLDSVAIRCPQNSTLLKLLKRLPFPLAAPSANPFGYVSPTTSEHVSSSLGDKLEIILEGNNCKFGIESTIIDLRTCIEPKILRHGPITKEMLEEFSGTKFEESVAAPVNKLRAPGMLKSHYSPKAPLEINSRDKLMKLVASKNSSRVAFIFQMRPKNSEYQKLPNIYWLSETGEELEIAQNFYHLLRVADALDYQKIHIEEIDDNAGISTAIRDRLLRAATQIEL